MNLFDAACVKAHNLKLKRGDQIMESEKKEKCNHAGNAGMCGPVWFAGWLFTLGFLKLAFWKAILALILWPYYLGAHLALLKV
jgi:hypothetical protein